MMLSAVGACANVQHAPTDVIASYVSALRDGRTADAYRLLSSEARGAVTYEQFADLARSNPDEVRETARWLGQVDTDAPVTAHIELPSGDRLNLVLESGAWRLDATALDFYGQHTPRQALRSFLRALSRGRYDVLVRFAPRRIAEHLTPESLQAAWERGDDVNRMQTMREQLVRAQDNAIEVVGERATMQYQTYTMRFVREDGVWKIEDPG